MKILHIPSGNLCCLAPYGCGDMILDARNYKMWPWTGIITDISIEYWNDLWTFNHISIIKIDTYTYRQEGEYVFEGDLTVTKENKSEFELIA